MSTLQPDARSALLDEVDRLRAWAASYPNAGRTGEWECDYSDWRPLYAGVIGFIEKYPVPQWSSVETSAVLYAIARDNEMEHLIEEIGERSPDVLTDLAEAAIHGGEWEARWQFAVALGRSSRDPTRRDGLLLRLARDDDNEYVRRRALGALAHLRSPATETLALEAWSRPDEWQQWSRMMALSALWSVGSVHLSRLLAEADADGRPYLAATAAKVRNGTAERL